MKWLQEQPDLPPLVISADGKLSLRETTHGKFVRLYLDRIRTKASPDALGTMKDSELVATIVGSMNPAQVELAASLTAEDLGLTIDIGRGKGLDVADVKATTRHLSAERSDAILGAAIRQLENRGVRFSPQLLAEIHQTRTLRIQCTASANSKTNLSTVLLVEPMGDELPKKDVLKLDRLLLSDLDGFPRLKDWLALMRLDLTGSPTSNPGA